MTTKKNTPAIDWPQHVRSQLESGKSRKAYCDEHGLKLHQFNYYLRGKGKKRKITTAFARVIVPATAPAKTNATARLLFGDGTTLEFGAGSDPAWIARVVAQFRGSI